MYANDRINNITHDINQTFHEYFGNNASLIWFGSWVKGDAYLQSDIDLAIKHNKPLNKKCLLDFWHYLEDFPTLYKIDLVDMDYADDHLKNQINKYGKVL